MNVFVAGYKGSGFGGKFIARFTFGRFSHVSLVFDFRDETGTGYIQEIDALQGRGVSTHPDGQLKGERGLYHVPCSEETADDIYHSAMSLIGCKYDWSGIWGFLRRKKKENPNKWFCSELVAHCLKENGVELYRLPAWKISPVMVCASVAINPTEKES